MPGNKSSPRDMSKPSAVCLSTCKKMTNSSKSIRKSRSLQRKKTRPRLGPAELKLWICSKNCHRRCNPSSFSKRFQKKVILSEVALLRSRGGMNLRDETGRNEPLELGFKQHRRHCTTVQQWKIFTVKQTGGWTIQCCQSFLFQWPLFIKSKWTVRSKLCIAKKNTTENDHRTTTLQRERMQSRFTRDLTALYDVIWHMVYGF